MQTPRPRQHLLGVLLLATCTGTAPQLPVQSALSATEGTLGQHCAKDVAAGTDLVGHDCCGGTQTLNSSDACCAACLDQVGAGCRFWTYAAGRKHCYLKNSDAARCAVFTILL